MRFLKTSLWALVECSSGPVAFIFLEHFSFCPIPEPGAEAAVQADQAAVEQAELNLGYTKVRSLIAGIAQGQVENLVSPSTVLTRVSQVNPIKAYFEISESG